MTSRPAASSSSGPLSPTVIKERRERSQSVMSLQGRLVRFPWCQASGYSGRFTLRANKEDNQLPSEANEDGLEVMSGSQRKLSWPRPGHRLARGGRGAHKCWWQVYHPPTLTSYAPPEPLPFLCSLPSDSAWIPVLHLPQVFFRNQSEECEEEDLR